MKAAPTPLDQPTLIFLVTEDWYFVSHRLPLGKAAASAGFRVVIASRIGAHEATFRAAGFEIEPLEWTRGVGHPLSELRFLLRLVRLYRRRRPAVVHHVALKPVVYGSLAAMVARVPVVINAVAGLGYVFTNKSGMARVLQPMVRLAFRFLLNRRSVRVIVQNPDDLKFLELQAGVDPGRAVLISGAGVDTSEFSPRPEPTEPNTVLLPARLLWDKGVGEFVAAARQLRADGVKARFVLAGGIDHDNPRAIPQATVDQWVAEGVVEWWGHQSAMKDVYPQAHVVVLPSYREGLPKSLLEAMACGRPIVTTDVPGCREVVRDGDNGLLVPARDSARLADAIGRLLKDEGLRRRMGARGRERVISEFSVEQVIQQTLPLYRPGVSGS